MAETQISWDHCLDYAAVSDIGMRRSNNQDSYAVNLASDDEVWSTRGHVFLVADGMGAHAAGELASQLAADGVPHLYLKHRDLSAPEALQKAVIDTNAEVNRKGQANIEFHNMGTTCSVLTILPQGAVLAHIGDSRVYRLRGNQLEQLTFDHSLVWEMQASGQLSENSDLAAALPKNVITRSLGPNETVKVDIEGPFLVEIGDTFLLCSDGLTGKVEDDELAAILANLPPKESAQALVDLANLRGGPDNITVIVAKVTGHELTTQVAAQEPLTIGKSKNPSRVHPLMWTMMVACFLAGIVIAGAGSIPAGGGALVLGLVLLVIILLQMSNTPPDGVTINAGQRFGKGPYVSVSSEASKEFTDKLSGTIVQLREAAKEQGWTVDWASIDQQSKTAEKSASSGETGLAVAQYLRAISFLMKQVRDQRNEGASDSAIDLV